MMIHPLWLVVVNVGLGVVGQFFLKRGMTIVGDTLTGSPFQFFFKAFTSPFVLGGLAFYVVSLLIWLVVLSKVDLSLAYPLISLSYVFVILVSWLFLGESINLLRILAVVFIMIGVILLGQSAR